MNLNKAMIIGNLTRDPEMRNTNRKLKKYAICPPITIPPKYPKLRLKEYNAIAFPCLFLSNCSPVMAWRIEL